MAASRMVNVLALCALGALTAEAAQGPPAGILAAVSDVRAADGYTYALHDDAGHSMDAVRVLRLPQSPPPPPLAASKYMALYHTLDGPTATFNVHAAVSDDLLTWRWADLVAANSDMPFLTEDASISSSRVVLVHEQWIGRNSSAPCRIAARVYASMWDLIAGVAPVASYIIPNELSPLEGTPAVPPGGFNSLLDQLLVSFHYNDAASHRDQQGGGLLTGLGAGEPVWRAWKEAAVDAALTAAGAIGNIGGRALEVVPCNASRGSYIALELHEGNLALPTNWSDWRIFAHDRGSPLAAGFSQLAITTHGGSASFGNPGLVLLPGAGSAPPILAVSYFIFGEAAAPGEAGSLLFFRALWAC